MKAMIFAAGFGTRLKPLTDRMPKALVPVGGVPMLERVICKLRDAGLGPVVVNAHHFSGQIRDFLAGHDFGVPVVLSMEDGPAPLETGGGIKHAAPLLQSRCCCTEGRFLVHNVDIMSNLDVEWFMNQDDPASLATLLLVDKEADRYLLFNDDMRLVGWTNAVTGEVKSPFPGLDPSECRRYSFCGVHLISEEIFPLMDSWPECFGIIDFYLSECARHLIRGVVAPGLTITDIGTPSALADAERLFR